jgi:RNA methyltransferase, TrmH family
VISNPNNPTIRQIRKLRKRREREKSRQLIVEGHRALAVAIASGSGVSRVLHTRSAATKRGELLRDAKARGAAIQEVSPAVMQSLTSVDTAPDVLGIASLPSCTLDEAVARFGLGAVLAGVRDPATAGSILSSCAAAGGAVAIATKGTTDLFAPKPVRSGAGAHFVLAIASDVAPEDCATALRAAGVRSILVEAGAPGADQTGPGETELGDRLAIVIGEDGSVPAALASQAERQVGAGGRRSEVRPSLGAEAAVVLFTAARVRAGSAGPRRGDE